MRRTPSPKVSMPVPLSEQVSSGHSSAPHITTCSTSIFSLVLGLSILQGDAPGRPDSRGSALINMDGKAREKGVATKDVPRKWPRGFLKVVQLAPAHLREAKAADQ